MEQERETLMIQDMEDKHIQECSEMYEFEKDEVGYAESHSTSCEETAQMKILTPFAKAVGRRMACTASDSHKPRLSRARYFIVMAYAGVTARYTTLDKHESISIAYARTANEYMVRGVRRSRKTTHGLGGIVSAFQDDIAGLRDEAVPRGA